MVRFMKGDGGEGRGENPPCWGWGGLWIKRKPCLSAQKTKGGGKEKSIDRKRRNWPGKNGRPETDNRRNKGDGDVDKKEPEKGKGRPRGRPIASRKKGF